MKTKIVSEIGINHNGDINIAKQMIDIAATAGIPYVKFQKRNPDLCVPEAQKTKMRDTPWGYITYLEYKKKIEFEEKEYDEIDNHCYNRIEWFSSPWDVDSAYFLCENYPDIPYIKLASACITDTDLLEVVKQHGIPVIMSTGMSNKKEVDNCINFLGDQVEYILACNSSYPTKDADMNLKFIQTLKFEYPMYRIGFSNHSPGIQHILSSVVLGAEMVEFHQTLDRSMYGTDQGASIETPGVFKIVKMIKAIEVGMGNGEWIVTKEEEEMKKKLRRVL